MTRRIAAEALVASGDEEHRTDAEKTLTEGASPMQDALRTFQPLLRETVLTRTVDNFLSYVAELLSVVFKARPETLRSDETVRLDELLRHNSMDALVEELAERRVERLAYRSLGDLRKYIRDRLGFDVFDSEREFDQAARMVEYRNVVVHNRGVVSRAFLSRLPASGYSLGDRLRITSDEVFDGLENFDRVVASADHRAAAKWGIPQTVSHAEVLSYAPGGER